MALAQKAWTPMIAPKINVLYLRFYHLLKVARGREFARSHTLQMIKHNRTVPYEK